MHVLLRLLAVCLPALASAATVSADRFGFDPVDATAALQAGAA